MVAKKDLFEQRADRLVVNISSSPTLSGASALQVLERSPGVIVDKMSGSISLVGKAGVRMMINGKLSHIPADGLLQYLSGMSADNIDRIELITSPPSNLDAEGSAGYINLVMKRRPDDGLSGSVALSGGYGEGELGNGSANVNYQRGGVNLYGTYSFLWNAQKQLGSSYRRAVGADGVTEMPAATWRDPVQRNHDARAGIEYEINGRTTLGAQIAAYDNRWSMEALNRLTIKHGGTPISVTDSDNSEVNHWRHAMGNLNVQHKLGSGGSLRADIDYLRYSNENPTVYLNTTTDAASGRKTTEQMESGKSTPLGILVASADYTGTGERWQFGAGVKGAFSRFINETSLEGPAARQAWVTDAGFGSRVSLDEDVLAAYASADFTPSNATTLKMGLRYELTDSNLGSEQERDIVDRRFGTFFPSVSVSHKLGDSRQIDAAYTRRITRPSFRDMAPFLYFLDPNTFFSGNAALQPAIISSVKLGGTYESVLLSLEYAWEDSTIARFQNRFVPEHQIHIWFPANYRQMRTATALVAAPVHPASWWSAQNSAMLMRQEVDAARDGVPVALASTSYHLSSTQNLSLPHDYTLEASGFYQSASLLGAMDVAPQWQVSLGLQKTLASGAKITLAVNDVFDSLEWTWNTGASGDAFYSRQLIDLTRRSVTLSYSMTFGSGKVADQRTSASEEERDRAQ